MILLTYFCSSSAYRVRIALNLHGLAQDAVPVHLLRDGGGHQQAAYRALNPLGINRVQGADAIADDQRMAR